LPCLKNARRIFAIVSTTSIPTSTSKNHGSRYGPSVPGFRLDADHPEKGSFLHADSHSSLDGITPDHAYFTPLPLRLAA
jgi:hypothetical protein